MDMAVREKEGLTPSPRKHWWLFVSMVIGNNLSLLLIMQKLNQMAATTETCAFWVRG